MHRINHIYQPDRWLRLIPRIVIPNDDFDLPVDASPTKVDIYLFDCYLWLRIVTPERGIHQNQSVDTSIATIISHMLFEHRAWWPMRATLFRVIKDALYPKEYVWERNAETGINTYEGKVDTEAALTNLDVTVDYAAAFWKTVSYKGCIGDTGVWLEYEARTYISHVNPDPYGIDNCFLDVHRFPLGRPHVAGPEPMTYAIGERNNISNSPGVLEMHENRNRENFDHTFAWTTFDSSLVIAAAWSERDRRNRTVVD